MCQNVTSSFPLICSHWTVWVLWNFFNKLQSNLPWPMWVSWAIMKLFWKRNSRKRFRRFTIGTHCHWEPSHLLLPMSVPERRENIKCIGDRGHRVAIPEHFGRFSKLHSQQSKTRRWGWFHLAINAYVRASQRTKTDHFGSICSPVTPPSLCGTESALGSWLKMSALQKHSKRCFKVRKDGSHASELNFWKGLFQTCSLCRENRRDLSPSPLRSGQQSHQAKC